MKDKAKKDPDLYALMGEGLIDFKTTLPEAALSGLKHVSVEQRNNYVPDAPSCVEKSARYM